MICWISSSILGRPGHLRRQLAHLPGDIHIILGNRLIHHGKGSPGNRLSLLQGANPLGGLLDNLRFHMRSENLVLACHGIDNLEGQLALPRLSG